MISSFNRNRFITEIQTCGAPDPTAGASASEETRWCVDETKLREKIKTNLAKFCYPSSPRRYQYIFVCFSCSSSFKSFNACTLFVFICKFRYAYPRYPLPPAVKEFGDMLRPLRSRNPTTILSLLSIIGEMLKRRDRNALRLLDMLTEELVARNQVSAKSS